MKKLKIAIKIVIGVFLVLCVSLVIFIKSFNINEYKNYIQQTVSSALGREFAIHKDIQLGISLSPTIILKEVSLSNPDWAKNRNMVELEEAKVQLSLLNLLYGKIYVSEINVKGLNVWLEENAKGQNNWTFDTNTSSIAEGSITQNPQTQIEGKNFIISYGFGSIALKNSNISYMNSKDNSSHSILLSDVILKGSGALSLDATYSSYNISLNGKFPDVENLINGSNDFTFELDASVNDEHFANLSGKIDNLLDMSGITISATANGSYNPYITQYDLSTKLIGDLQNLSLKDIVLTAENKNEYAIKASGSVNDLTKTQVVDLKVHGDVQKIDGTPLNPISGDLSVLSGKNNKYFTVGINLSAKSTDLVGVVNIDLSEAKPYIHAALQSKYFSLPDILDISSSNGTSAAVSASGDDKVTNSDAKEEDIFLLPSDPLPFSYLSMVNADVEFDADDIVITGTNKRAKADIQASVKDSVLHLSFDATEKRSNTNEVIDGELSLNAKDSSNAIAELKLNGHNIIIEEVLKNFVSNDIQGGIVTLIADLKTHGDSIHRLSSNLNGNISLLVEQASVKNSIIMNIGGDVFAQIIDLLKIDFKEQKENIVDIQCAAANLNFKNGQASFNKKIALETSRLFATISGDLNLSTERMDLSLSIDSQEGLKLGLFDTLANLIKIQGTFSEPSVGVSVMGTATTAATVGAAFMTGGLSFIGQTAFDVLKPSSNPCAEALADSGISYQAVNSSAKESKSAGTSKAEKSSSSTSGSKSTDKEKGNSDNSTKNPLKSIFEQGKKAILETIGK